MVTRDWGEEGMGSYCLMGTKFPFGMIKKLCTGDGYTTLCIHLMPPNCNLNMAKMLNFCYIYFSTIQKKLVLHF